ncbi:hypothetical protein [Oceaniglobus trochenteri]|uniref:hypothetical protein n=1 Tax=Oceaniglobus trochenteri TaxID=2763260 RepID=UPI001CFFB2E9|nr:hypothetical protein [Oceaniglobus trochenteri]
MHSSPDALLPDVAEWDEAIAMPRTLIDGHPFHTMWIAADHAVALLEHGGTAEIERAVAVLTALDELQDQDPASPTFGNFRWEREDPGVEDLNAAVFYAVRIAPMMHRFAHRLPDTARGAVGKTLHRVLTAIERIDVGPEYTNIISQSVASLIVGGQYLGDAHFRDLGAARFRAWMALIDESGLAHEFNSPVYTQMTVTALRLIGELAEDRSLARRAGQVALRQILSVALHVNGATGRMAAPHCRAYHPFLVGETRRDLDILKDWIARGWAPDWVLHLTDPAKGQVRETSDAARGTHLVSHHQPRFSFGTASRELDTQNNRYIAAQSTAFALHYAGRGGAPGTVFCKYIWNDQWLGEYATTPSRPRRQVFFDHGAFVGVQDGPRMFGAYRPRRLNAWDATHDAKACIVVARAKDVRALWVGGQKVGSWPVEAPRDAAIGIDLGPVHLVIRPLSSGELQPGLTNRIVERDGMLAVELRDYHGTPRTFWSQARPGAFFHGHIRAGFFIEAQAAQGDLTDFVKKIASGRFTDQADPPCRPGTGQRHWTLEYERDGRAFGMTIDLHDWRRIADWAGGAPVGLPMLDSRIARQTATGRVTLASASLRCGPAPAWLVALPDHRIWAAGVHPGGGGDDILLTTPEGTVRVTGSAGATILCREGSVTADHLDPGARIEVSGALRLA